MFLNASISDLSALSVVSASALSQNDFIFSAFAS
jgi:hypothetical protein